MDHLCYLCFVFVMLSHLFIAALWSWLLFVMFIVILLHSHLVYGDRCGTCVQPPSINPVPGYPLCLVPHLRSLDTLIS